MFAKKNKVVEPYSHFCAPDVHIGDVVTVSAANGYAKLFMVVDKGSLSIGHEGHRYMTDSDHRLELVRLNEWTLGDSVPPEQQVRDDAAGSSAADDAPDGQ